jgi:ribosomal protein S18 acetylase RimI-like enzyme
VIPLVGWSRHVGSLRLVVDPQCRGKGIGRALARHGLVTGLEMGLTKIVVEVVAHAAPAIGMFEAIGFEPEALLRDHVRDKSGELRDLVVLAHLVEGTWSGMATAGIAEDVQP